MKRHAWAGAMELALKHIFSRDIMPYLYDISGILHRIDQSGGRDYVSVILQYLLERGEVKNKYEFFELVNEKISPEVGEKVMTLAEQLKAEGMALGEAKQQVETAERLLAENVDLAFIAKISGLSLDEVEVLKRNRS